MKRTIRSLICLLISFGLIFNFFNIVYSENADNVAILFNEKHSSYDESAEQKRLEIVNSQNIVKPSNVNNTTFYISENGNDSNDGRSPESAWKSTDNLWNYSWFNYGDVVLFERGSIYRNAHFVMMNGISYGAYGTGAKPALYGSAYNYADEKFWLTTSTPNVWKIQLDSEITNIGNIVFDLGKYCGNYLRNKNLKNDFDFWEDTANNCLYLYYSKGNPGKVFEDIEI
ncbi:MAG: hypothetical protein IIU65_05585, partial [Clostridia bacterium]|nr:hypothetical protein [Clostridia bacterium]